MAMGCVPQQSVNSSYKECAQTPNMVARNHNHKLLHCLSKLNSHSRKRVFITLDLYNSFISVINSMNKKRSSKLFLSRTLTFYIYGSCALPIQFLFSSTLEYLELPFLVTWKYLEVKLAVILQIPYKDGIFTSLTWEFAI